MAMVSNLKSASGDWHKELILQNFLPEESAHILPILSLAVDSPDILNWSLDCFGIYSVKTGCSFAAAIPTSKDMEFFYFILACCHRLSLKELELLVVVIWCIWLSRNKWVHNNVKLPADGVIAWAKAFLADLEAVGKSSYTNIVASSCPAICPTPPRWSFPTLDCFKLNTDVATDYTNKVVGLGSIICNDQGLMMAASLRKVAADNAEALGILSGIQLVVNVSVFPFLVESDSKVVVGLINCHGVNRTSLGLIVDSIRKLASSMLCSLRDQEQVSTTK
ncbi:hypothetical protein ACOSQ4_021003 [Xanthoceras sorbifolium]